jgi:hypothetical protein
VSIIIEDNKPFIASKKKKIDLFTYFTVLIIFMRSNFLKSRHSLGEFISLLIVTEGLM